MFSKRIFLTVLLLTSFLYSQKKVACIGNSITFGSLLSNPTTESYPAQLRQLLGNQYEVDNYGSPNRVLLNGFSMSYQNSAQFFSSLLQHYDIIVICLGTNDTQTLYRSSYDNFIEDYKDLINHYDNYAGMDAPLCIVGIPPPIFSAYDDHSNDYLINEIIPRTKTVVNHTNSNTANFYNALKNKPEMFIDGVHPTVQGAGVMAQVVKQVITNALNPDITPPAKPTNFSSTFGNGFVGLNWSSNSEPDLHHYNLYRGTTEGGFMNYLTSPSSSQTMYTDNTVVNSTTYYYQISAIDNSNNESVRSSQISATPAAPVDTTPPSTPTNFYAVSNNGHIVLSWDLNSEDDIWSYSIFKGTDDNGGWMDLLTTLDKNTSTYMDTVINPYTTYYYKISAQDLSDNISDRSTQISTTTLNIKNRTERVDISLNQNTPNPFNPITIISYTIPYDSDVNIAIYDLMGNEIKTLVNEYKSVGQYKVNWDGNDDSGQSVSGGIYFYTLHAGDFIQTRKMLLLR